MSDLKTKKQKQAGPQTIPSEHVEQTLFFQALRHYYPLVYLFTAAVPNGGARDKRTGAMLKAEGVKAGYPDVLIDIALKGYYGLRIEMKRSDPKLSRVSKEQKDWHVRLTAAGYLVVVAYGWQEALKSVEKYIENEEIEKCTWYTH